MADDISSGGQVDPHVQAGSAGEGQAGPPAVFDEGKARREAALRNLEAAHRARSEKAALQRMKRPPKHLITLANMPDEGITREGINWNDVRRDFIESEMTQEQLGQKYGLAEKTIQKRSGRGNWWALRYEFRSGVERKKRERVQNLIVARDVERYEELEALAKHIRIQLSRKDEQGNVKLLAPEMIQRLASSLDTVIKNQRLILGQSTANVKLVDGLIERILGVVEKYVPEQDRVRLADEFARVIDTTATVGAAQDTEGAGRAA